MSKYSQFKIFIKNNFLFVLIVSLSFTLLFELCFTRQKIIELDNASFKYSTGLVKIIEKEVVRNEYMSDKDSKIEKLRRIGSKNAIDCSSSLYDLNSMLKLHKTRNVSIYLDHLEYVMGNDMSLEELKKQFKKYIIW
ncbi:MAG: hypothetical protein N4A40_14520 [Tissierellales bacterium]|nr:hypothetical protein [Tissierellales bacterium]